MNSLQAMHVFTRVVELGSFSKAASDLGMGQPSATKLVAQLEKKLDARLLFRSTQGVRVTEVGALYYERCRQIVQQVEEADTVAALTRWELHGALRISTTMDFGRRVLMPLVCRFLQGNPKVSIEVLFDDRYVNLIEQGIDLAIRMGRLSDSAMGSRFLCVNPWSVVASPAYLARRGRPQTPFDLPSHEALIVSTVQNDSRWHFRSSLGEDLTVQVRGPIRSNNKSALMSAACAGLGIAVLPTYVVHGCITSGALVKLLPDWPLPEQDVHAVYPSPRLVPLKVTRFVDWLADRFGPKWWEAPFTADQDEPLARAAQAEPSRPRKSR